MFTDGPGGTNPADLELPGPITANSTGEADTRLIFDEVECIVVLSKCYAEFLKSVFVGYLQQTIVVIRASHVLIVSIQFVVYVHLASLSGDAGTCYKQHSVTMKISVYRPAVSGIGRRIRILKINSGNTV